MYVLFLLYKVALFVLQQACEGELMEDEVNIVLKVLDDVVVGVKEVYMMVVNVVIRLVIFLNADVHLTLVNYLYVPHVLVDDVLVDFPCLFPQVQKILVIAVS